MEKSSVLAVIDAEIKRLNEARRILAGNDGFRSARATSGRGGTRKTMSAAARQRISAAQKKRWAKIKKAAA